jgi:serine/threonine protein kinase
MPAENTDLNLLFGVLAVQAGLLDAHQFAEACSAWAARRDRPLADILAGRGWMTAEDRDHLDYLLGRALQRHEGDAHASLAALTTDGVRQALFVLDDADVRRSLDGEQSPAATTDYEPTSRHHFRLTRLHAKGGTGQVWLAHDEDLGRDVALKELRPDRGDSPAAMARFLEEARITGQLEHPGIVPVYELVQSQGDRPCYAMRFVGDRTLAHAIKEYHSLRRAGRVRPIDLRGLLTAFVSVCNAVAYAHSRGVLHRDLKPRNVALGDFGEVLVLDWGLAKVAGKPEDPLGLPPVTLEQDDGREETRQGQVLGTPAYMAPEQAGGRVDLVSERSEIYGLGAILYAILTGEPPFVGNDVPEVLRRVVRESPEPPRQRVAATPPALEAVCLKALAKEPERRYQSARELARDVERFLADQPVASYRESLRAQLGRWAKWHQQLVSGAIVLLMSGLAGMGIMLLPREYTDWRKAAERDRAEISLKAELARSYCDLGLFQRKSGRREDSESSYKKAMWLYEDLAERDSNSAEMVTTAEGWPREVEWDEGPGRLSLRLRRVLSLAHAHDVRARGEADRLTEAKDINAWTLYRLACFYASEFAHYRSETLAAQAVELLRQAVSKGYEDVDQMKQDSSLDPLRSRDDFKKLLAGLERKN